MRLGVLRFRVSLGSVRGTTVYDLCALTTSLLGLNKAVLLHVFWDSDSGQCAYGRVRSKSKPISGESLNLSPVGSHN